MEGVQINEVDTSLKERVATIEPVSQVESGVQQPEVDNGKMDQGNEGGMKGNGLLPTLVLDKPLFTFV